VTTNLKPVTVREADAEKRQVRLFDAEGVETKYWFGH
jgi:hypothetical protein